MHNLKADDVLLPKRQRELADVAAGAGEVQADASCGRGSRSQTAARPRKWTSITTTCDGKLADSRNEVVQIGFRLAKQMKLPEVWGIDVEGDFPYDAVQEVRRRCAARRWPKQLDALARTSRRMLNGLNRV